MALVPIGPSVPGLQSNLANMPEYVIEGVVARPECRGEVGQVGAYRRYRVNCPWHREGKGQCCSRSRNIDKGMHIYAYYECNDEQGDLISFQIVLANKEGE